MKCKKIQGNTCRYVSEIKEIKENGLPAGVINKKIADVGATYYAATCDYNYIIVCPTIDLIKSIAADVNNVYPIFTVFSGIQQKDYNSFISTYNPKYIKIVVTYDKFDTLSSWIDTSKFRVLVDEYHLLLQTIDYRETAINSLFNSLEQYKHVSFISATPINKKFEIEKLKVLPHYEIDWKITSKLVPYRIKSNNVISTTKRLIKLFLEKKLKPINFEGKQKSPEELYIFLNSVKSIKKICKDMNLNPDEVKICCSNKTFNVKKLNPYTITDVVSPNKKLNFFTSKCFQGCNLFTNSGLIIVCSDCNKKSMLTDISSDIVQIAGRLRYNDKFQNEFRNTIVHVYNTKNIAEDDETFNNCINEIKTACKDLLKIQKQNPKEAKSMVSRLKISKDFLFIEDGIIKYSQNKEMFYRYLHELKKMYANGINIKNSYNNFIFDPKKSTQETVHEKIDIFNNKLDLYSCNSYKEVVLLFYRSKNKDIFYSNYPEFRGMYKYFTCDEVSNMEFRKERIVKASQEKEYLASTIDSVLYEGFITLKDLKKNIKTVFNKNKIIITPKASLAEKSEKFIVIPKTKRLGKKFIKGYDIKLKK